MAGVKLITHRCRGFGPENSLTAFRAALNSQVDGIEIDLRLTKDKKFVVIHNRSYMFDGRRYRVNQVTCNQAVQQGVDSVEEFLLLFKKFGEGKELHLDVKESGRERQLVTLVKAHGLLRRVTVVSWIGCVLERIHKLAPSLRLSYSFRTKIRSSYTTGRPIGPAIRIPLILRERRVPLAAVNVLTLTHISRWLHARLAKHTVEIIVVNVDTVRGNLRLAKRGFTSMTNTAPFLLAQRELL